MSRVEPVSGPFVIIERARSLPEKGLAHGGHVASEDEFCLLEAVAYVAGEPHTAHPECASRVLGKFGRSLNDALDSVRRQRLLPLATEIVGTADDGHDQERGLMAADWIIRVCTPTLLRRAGLESEAASLETLSRRSTWDDVEAAVPVLRTARASTEVAWVTATTADARDTTPWAVDAVAVAFASVDAVDAVVGAVARGTAKNATWAAANTARYAARIAARGTFSDALQPTVDALQDSAIDLYERMVRVGR